MPEGLREVHVGLRSGESLSLASLNLVPGVPHPIRVSMVYPADATPGHLLSVVPSSQLARVQEEQRQLALARQRARPAAAPAAPPPAVGVDPAPAPAAPTPRPVPTLRPVPAPPPIQRFQPSPPPLVPPLSIQQSRDQPAIEVQRQLLRTWQTP
jgi:hypothetical protein